VALLGLDTGFWRDRSVLVTGHTGFKGGWLSLWLRRLGARVHGYALPPATTPALFQAARLDELLQHQLGDLRDFHDLSSRLQSAQPEIVFHLAAQALVREGYRDPLGTVASNILGTAHLLEAVRHQPSVRALVLITSDKCYQNQEWLWPYRENEALGGRDPYSASKACAEIITTAWRESFPREGLSIATARAGNVIGGGDWAADRLVPDALRAWQAGEVLRVRQPLALRPWQHVLDALHGYLLLAQRLYAGEAAEAWNFGPGEEDIVPVGELLDRLARLWGQGAIWNVEATQHQHEANLLRLDSSKARSGLGWRPRWPLDTALARIVAWHNAFLDGADARQLCLADIQAFESATH
jgi:CDP-glucose 4,6-dehydratase